jgi:hypothetical protein
MVTSDAVCVIGNGIIYSSVFLHESTSRDAIAAIPG